MDMKELKEQFDELTVKIIAAQERCGPLYGQWKDACDELRRVERERSDVWNKMMDVIRS